MNCPICDAPNRKPGQHCPDCGVMIDKPKPPVRPEPEKVQPTALRRDPIVEPQKPYIPINSELLRRQQEYDEDYNHARNMTAFGCALPMLIVGFLIGFPQLPGFVILPFLFYWGVIRRYPKS